MSLSPPPGAKFDSSYDRRQPLAFTIGVGQASEHVPVPNPPLHQLEWAAAHSAVTMLHHIGILKGFNMRNQFLVTEHLCR